MLLTASGARSWNAIQGVLRRSSVAERDGRHMHDGAADTHAASAKAYEQERSGMDVRQDAQYVSPTIARALGTAPDCSSASAAPRSRSMLSCAALHCTCGPRRVWFYRRLAISEIQHLLAKLQSHSAMANP